MFHKTQANLRPSDTRIYHDNQSESDCIVEHIEIKYSVFYTTYFFMMSTLQED